MAYGSASQAESAMRKRIGGSNPSPLRRSAPNLRREVSTSVRTPSDGVTPCAVTEHVDRSICGHFDRAVSAFVGWLRSFGELSYDFQTFYASPLGRRAKSLYYRNRLLGTVAVAPIVFCEAFVPSARRLFWTPQRFPIADAHYAMGFARRYETTGDDRDYRAAVRYLEALLESRCAGYDRYGWGYPFDWEGITGTIKSGTPLITTLPYVYEAFAGRRGHRCATSLARRRGGPSRSTPCWTIGTFRSRTAHQAASLHSGPR